MAEFTKDQLALIECNRYINVEHEWWDSTFDWFIETAALFGLDVDREDIAFSGFSSQGDGASFGFRAVDLLMVFNTTRASLDAGALPLPSGSRIDYKFLDIYNAIYDALGPIVAELQPTWATAKLDALVMSNPKISNYYRHSGARQVDLEVVDLAQLDEEEKADGLFVMELREALDSAVTGVADALHRVLEEEHDHLTSDESVWDALVANDMVEVPRVAA